MDNIIGLMVAISKEISLMDLEMGMGCGREEWGMLIDMMEIIETIRNGVMGCLLGRVVISIKETIRLMRATV